MVLLPDLYTRSESWLFISKTKPTTQRKPLQSTPHAVSSFIDFFLKFNWNSAIDFDSKLPISPSNNDKRSFQLWLMCDVVISWILLSNTTKIIILLFTKTIEVYYTDCVHRTQVIAFVEINYYFIKSDWCVF